VSLLLTRNARTLPTAIIDSPRCGDRSGASRQEDPATGGEFSALARHQAEGTELACRQSFGIAIAALLIALASVLKREL
jgi:hypothetical protein